MPLLSNSFITLSTTISFQEDHQTQVETAQERASFGRPVGRDYIPLSQSPQLSRLTFGRKNRTSSVDLVSCGTANAAVTAATRGRGISGREERQPSLLPSEMKCDHARRGSGLHPPSTGLAVLGCGGASARKVIGSRRAFPSSSLTPLGKTKPASRLSSTSKKEEESPQRSNRPAAERGDYDTAFAANSIGTASPELLYASGRITGARYHEMLAGMNRRGFDRSTALGPRVGTRTCRETGAAGVGKAVTSQGHVGGSRSTQNSPQKK